MSSNDNSFEDFSFLAAIGVLVFCLAIHSIISSVKTKINMSTRYCYGVSYIIVLKIHPSNSEIHFCGDVSIHVDSETFIHYVDYLNVALSRKSRT